MQNSHLRPDAAQQQLALSCKSSSCIWTNNAGLRERTGKRYLSMIRRVRRAALGSSVKGGRAPKVEYITAEIGRKYNACRKESGLSPKDLQPPARSRPLRPYL